MKWITRERPKIDRIACPWLIARFIDPAPEFLYVPAERVLPEAERSGATPYDVPGVEFGHRGELCSFDAFVTTYGLHDPALARLALIVRAADCGHPHTEPEAAGLLAISRGLSLNFENDHEMLAHGMVIHDALYAHCSSPRPAHAQSPSPARHETLTTTARPVPPAQAVPAKLIRRKGRIDHPAQVPRTCSRSTPPGRPTTGCARASSGGS